MGRPRPAVHDEEPVAVQTGTSTAPELEEMGERIRPGARLRRRQQHRSHRDAERDRHLWTEHTARQWNRNIRVQSGRERLDYAGTARLLAVTNTAMADAWIGCRDGKYHYSFWRPVTAIQQGDTDGRGYDRIRRGYLVSVRARGKSR